MKKIFSIVLTLVLLAVGASAVLAADIREDDIAERHAQMVAERQEWLNELVAEGVITQEEADEFIANMEERYLNYCEAFGLGTDNERGFFRGHMFGDDGLFQFGPDDDFAPGAMGRGYGYYGSCLMD